MPRCSNEFAHDIEQNYKVIYLSNEAGFHVVPAIIHSLIVQTDSTLQLNNYTNLDVLLWAYVSKYDQAERY